MPDNDSSSPFTFANTIFVFGMASAGSFLVQVSYYFTDHVFILCLLALVSYLLASGIATALHHYFETNDGVVDYRETVYLMPWQCAIWLLGVMLPQYFFKFITEAFTSWVPPTWYEGISLAFVLLLLIVHLSLYMRDVQASMLTPIANRVRGMALKAGAYLSATANSVEMV